MYKEFRNKNSAGLTESTPQAWAKNFEEAKIINSFNRLSLPLTKMFRLIKKHIKATNEKPVLDAGCGMGKWVALLNEKGIPTVGLDWSSQMIECMRIFYATYSWHTGDIRKMPFPADTFSGVISWGVIEHDEEGPEKALEEFKRIIIPGGIAIFTVPVDNYLSRRCSRILHEQVNNSVFFQYFMTEDELRRFAQNAGFEVIDCGVGGNVSLAFLYPGLYKKLSPKWISLLNKVANVLFFWKKDARGMIYCVARKSSFEKDIKNYVF